MKNKTLKIFSYLTFPIIVLQLYACKHNEDSFDPFAGIPNKSIAKFSQLQYETADAIRGGRLYDKWWEAKNIAPPTASNPIWEEVAVIIPNAASNGNAGGQWRCKECHGWDYKGVNGAYDQNSDHYTGIRGFDNSNQAFNPEHIFKMISNGVVSYGSKADIPHQFIGQNLMSTADAYDLTKFIYDIARVDKASSTLGDSNRGESVFNSIPNALDPTWSCATAGCHSVTDDPSLNLIINIAKDNPQEFLHKVRFGAPQGSMPFGMDTIQAQDVLAYVAAGASFVSQPPNDFDQAKYNSLDSEDTIFGGKIYDKWWRVTTAVTKPTTTHSLWPNNNRSVTGSDTWRCSTCHGWDYRGEDGVDSNVNFQGIVTTNSFNMQYQDAASVYAFLQEDENHSFDNMFTDDEYYALTKFIITMRKEFDRNWTSSDFIVDETRLVHEDADALNGKLLYESTDLNCHDSNCHGNDGKALDLFDSNHDTFPNQFVHNIAQENPWKFVHKIRFGEAEHGNMPAMYDGNDEKSPRIKDAVDILAYAQSNLSPNLKRAGLLYDKWWEVDGIFDVDVPNTRNATWVANVGTADETVISNTSTWQCKQCHGWDYQGVDGAYNNSSKHYSGIRGFIPILDTVNKDKKYLINAIKNGVTNVELEDHDYGRFFSDADIELIADFILDENDGVPKSRTLYKDYLIGGNAINGKLIYKSKYLSNCESCHGTNGTKNTSVDIKAIANENPQKFIHKIRFGTLGSVMEPGNNGFKGLDLRDASDVLAYVRVIGSIDDPNILADYIDADSVRGGRLYDNWIKELQTGNVDIQVPVGLNPEWEQRNANVEDFPSAWTETEKIQASWRCSTCHAWDYKGIGIESGEVSSKGADNLLYKIELRRFNTFADRENDLHNFFYNWIKTGLGTNHRFGEINDSIPSPLTDADIWDLVKFLLDDSLVDTASNILSTGVVFDSDIENGNKLYNGTLITKVNCVICHGDDGRKSPPLDQGGSGESLDIFLNSSFDGEPWRSIHKIRFGEPGTGMAGIRASSSLNNQDAFDIMAYMQSQFDTR